MNAVLALLAAFFAAITTILTKEGLKQADAHIALAVQGGLFFLLAWCFALVKGDIVADLQGLDRKGWLCIAGAGVSTTVATFLAYRSLQNADASFVNSLERLSLVFASILAVVFLKEKLNWVAIVGIGLMTVGAVMVGLGKK